MNVRELITQLMTLDDPDAEVWLSKDPEGNKFYPLQEVVYGECGHDVERSDDEPFCEDVILWP